MPNKNRMSYDLTFSAPMAASMLRAAEGEQIKGTV
jgi:hypothetical protein